MKILLTCKDQLDIILLNVFQVVGNSGKCSFLKNELTIPKIKDGTKSDKDCITMNNAN